MKRVSAERKIVIVLFALVMIVFSFAQRDSKKLDALYAKTSSLTKNLIVQVQTNFSK